MGASSEKHNATTRDLIPRGNSCGSAPGGNVASAAAHGAQAGEPAAECGTGVLRRCGARRRSGGRLGAGPLEDRGAGDREAEGRRYALSARRRVLRDAPRVPGRAGPTRRSRSAPIRASRRSSTAASASSSSRRRPPGRPYAGGGKDEYRSTRAYPNLRHVVGSFGDSMIGLNTYYHAQDLRAENELMTEGNGKDANTDADPVYCGPGIWYDPTTGYIHVRLAHTHLHGDAQLSRADRSAEGARWCSASSAACRWPWTALATWRSRTW